MKIMILLFCFIHSAQAAFTKTSQQTYRIKDQKIHFVTDQQQAITISQNCIKKNKLSCQASAAILLAQKIRIDPLYLRGGANPGAAACLHYKVRGETVIGRNAQGRSNCFCHFKSDHSYVGCATLAAYVQTNL